MEPKFILNDSTRLAIVEELMQGDSFVNELVRRQRLIPSQARRAVKDLRERGVVDLYGNVVSLTPEGREMALRVRDYQRPFPTRRVRRRRESAMIRIAPEQKREQIRSRRI